MDFFRSNPRSFEQVSSAICSGFGRPLFVEDIYQHLTGPENLFLLKDREKFVAMMSCNVRKFLGHPTLILEGVAMDSRIQGQGIFGRMAREALDGQKYVCLRTQNPRMYRAFEKLCSKVYPNEEGITERARGIQESFAEYAGNEIDGLGVVKGHYGGLFYGTRPRHAEVDPLFRRLGVNLDEGDALLVVGDRFPREMPIPQE